MYNLATSNIVVTRGTVTDSNGDQKAANTVVYQGIADIQQVSNRYFDQATQTPRTVRSLNMAVASNADIQAGDWVQDVTWNVKYVVQDVTPSFGPLLLEDLTCNLKRVN